MQIARIAPRTATVVRKTRTVAVHTDSLEGMQIFGQDWSKRNVLTLIGVITGILIIPAVAILMPSGSNHAFSRAVADDLDPHEPTCLDDVAQVIPAGAAVCATLSGAWLDGIGPQGQDSHEAMALWTRQAHPPFLVLSSPHPYRHPDRLQESIDFVVCVQPPVGAERARNASSRMRLDVSPTSSVRC
jgi:hypothetical protein